MLLDPRTLECPACRNELETKADEFLCKNCGGRYPIENGIPVFVAQTQAHTVSSHKRKKSALRKLLRLLTPPHHSVYFDSLAPSYGEGKELKKFLDKHPGKTVLNIGSLSKNLKDLHPNTINLDIVYYPSVDIVADAHQLPFKDGSVDIVLFKNVLEHIKNPVKVMAEIHRVLKKGGYLYIKLPFLQPFHAVPDDYQRYTQSGMEELMKDYEKTEFGISVGPGSMISWMLREYLAILTSGGKYRLYELGLMFWGWLTFWIKYTDMLFWHNRLANRVVSAFYGIYRKI